jgi:hypothetical protein
MKAAVVVHATPLALEMTATDPAANALATRALA